MQLYINTYIYSVYIFRCIYIWRSYHFKVVNLFWAMSHVISLPFLFWQSTQGHLVIYQLDINYLIFYWCQMYFPHSLLIYGFFSLNFAQNFPWHFFSNFLLCLPCSCSFSIIFSNYSHTANCAQIFRHPENCSSFLSTLTSTH